MGRELEFWFDLSCPYAYLGSTRIEALAEATGATLAPRPMLLGGVFRAVSTPQNLAGTLSPAKARHMQRDLARYATLWDVPLGTPHHHPQRTVTALRAMLATGAPLMPLAHAFYRAYWVDGVDISTDVGVGAVLAGAGVEPGPVLEAAATQEVSDELRRRTQRAIDLGIFGAPACVVDGEMWWGQDRFGQVARALGDPTWDAPPPATPTAPVDYWFDYSSPYAAIASARVEAVLGAAARYRPMLLGAVFKAVGQMNVPLATFSAAKRRFVERDMARQAHEAGIPIAWPSRFPMRTVLPLRVTLAAGPDTPGGRRLVAGLFRAYWCDDQDIADPAVVVAVADRVGLDGEALVAAAGEAPTKLALHESTAAAVEAGVFGAPTFVVHGDGGRSGLFWGADRLDLAARAAAGERALI